MKRIEFASKRCLVLILSVYVLVVSPVLCAVSLDDLQWNRRLIVAFGENGDVGVERLLELVREQACQLDDRDIDVYLVTSQGVDSVTEEAGSLDEESVDSIVALRHATESGFALVLIGKDGGVKGRADTADELSSFLAMIDGMPMRQREVEERGENC